MPDHPFWLERVPAVLDFLASPDAPDTLDRGTIETLLGVRRRRAILILHACKASRRGRDLLAARKAFVAFLKSQSHEAALSRERGRQQQVAEALGLARRELAVPSISLPRQRTTLTLAGLPEGIHLTQGNLSIDFTTAQDLVEKMFTLAQGFADDYESLEAALQPDGKESDEDAGTDG
jgi:hypothetical protein